jgi:hypothetical protein
MLDYLQRLEDGGLSLSLILFGHMCLGWVGLVRVQSERTRKAAATGLAVQSR